MRKMEFTLDRFTKCILIVIAILLTVIAVELWAGRPAMLPPASAQMPDPGKWRVEIIVEARKTNQFLDQILKHLQAKPVKVTIQTSDKQPGKRGPTAGP